MIFKQLAMLAISFFQMRPKFCTETKSRKGPKSRKGRSANRCKVMETQYNIGQGVVLRKNLL